MLGLDLFVLNRKSKPIGLKEALGWTAMWVVLALLFNVGIYFRFGGARALEFFTAYLVEYSLSVDNLFVFLLVFNFFHVAKSHEHKVLFWGILGALVMRVAFILAGVTLIEKLHWTIYVLGAFLVIVGIRMLFAGTEQVHLEKNPALKLSKLIFPTTHEFNNGNFFSRKTGRLLATPLFIAVLVIEAMDVVFAVDSIPAVLSITLNAFIAYTSNIFAILGLRSLFFALSKIMGMFKFLKYGVSLILVFIGAKMLANDYFRIPTSIALAFVAAILAASIAASVIHQRMAKA